jgi:homoserine dehydrogenase
MYHCVNVGMLGCGNVGAAFAEFLLTRAPKIQEINGIDLRLTRIAVRDTAKKRSGILAPLITDNVKAVTDADDIDVVVEVMGGIEPARAHALAALRAGKPVVTANKELIAKHGPELYTAADSAGVDLFFETAAVASVPILRVLRESFLGEDITSILSIVNGTSNYMLTRMSEEGLAYAEALSQAQDEGYAEPDPTNDVSGADSASKLAILASLAFKRAIAVDDVEREGIDRLEREDFEISARFGYAIKSIAKADVFETGNGEREIGVQVFPALVDKNHPLASVRNTYNAVFLRGSAAGDQMFYGHGAGRLPSASALLGDLVSAADHLRRGTHRAVPLGSPAVLRPTERLAHPHYLKLEVTDAPGVLSEVSGVLGRHGVSIRSITQEDHASKARVVFITHRAEEGAMRKAVGELRGLESVLGIGTMLRIVEA